MLGHLMLASKKKDSNLGAQLFAAIKSGNLEIVKAIIEEDQSALERKDLDGDTPIFCAILSGQTEIVKAIIEKDWKVLEQKNSNRNGNAPIDLATTMSVMSSGRDNEDKASRVLNKVLESKFLGNIDKASQEDFKELFLKKFTKNYMKNLIKTNQ